MGVLFGLLALSAGGCIGAEGSWDDQERSFAAVGDSCGAPDGGVSSDGGAASAAAAAAPKDAGTVADAGTGRDGGTSSDGGTDGGPDAGSCTCPADTAWDGTRETIV